MDTSTKIAKYIGRLIAFPIIVIMKLLFALYDSLKWFYEKLILFRQDDGEENSLPKYSSSPPPPTREQYLNSEAYKKHHNQWQ